MSKTRNQRRRARMIERIVTGILILITIILLGFVVKMYIEIEDMQARQRGTEVGVVRAEDFLPAGFNAEDEAYIAALQRYDVEQGHVMPEQKEAAPESANSEAVDAREHS